MLWDNALEGFWLEKRKNLSQATVREYSVTFRRFREYLQLDEVHIEKIKSDDVRRFLDAMLKQGLSPKTVLNAWVALSSMWTWAETELNIPHVIRNRVAKPKYRRPQIVPYTRTEIGAMLNAVTKSAAWTTLLSANFWSKRSFDPLVSKDALE